MEYLLYYLYFFLVGASAGSFLNVLADRLPNNESILSRSHCDHCRKDIPWYDLVPLVSFFILKGRCRYCKKNLTFLYPLIEFATGVIFVCIAYLQAPYLIGATTKIPSAWIELMKAYPPQFAGFAMMISFAIISTLIVMFIADAKYQIIPDLMQTVLFICIIILKIPTRHLIFQNLIEGFVVMIPILLLYLITKGHGMGFGDVKLTFIMGFFLGLKPGFLAVYFAFILGALFGTWLLITKRKQLSSKIAFGPFLVIGTIIILFWGTDIMLLLEKIYGV